MQHKYRDNVQTLSTSFPLKKPINLMNVLVKMRIAIKLSIGIDNTKATSKQFKK